MNYMSEHLKPLIPLAPPFISAVLGFAAGKLDHKRKTAWDKRRLLYDQQVKAWQEIVSCFPVYIVSRARLRSAAEAEVIHSNSLNPDQLNRLQARKERYLLDRDTARLSLMVALEQLRVLFRKKNELLKVINDFEALEQQTKAASIDQLPPEDEWKRAMSNILAIVYNSIEPL